MPEPEVTDTVEREALGALTKAVYKRQDWTWDEFATKVFHINRKQENRGEIARSISRAQGTITVYQARLLVRIGGKCGLDIPECLEEYIVKRVSARRKPHETTLIAALGLQAKKGEESVKLYNGRYILFALDDQKNIVVSPHVLSSKIGEDGAPIFRARRRTPHAGTVFFTGVYFANEHQLYLISTPRGSVELRLAIFHIIHQTTQQLVRGSILRVVNNIVVSSRCILARDEFSYQSRCRLLRSENNASNFDGPKEIYEYLLESGEPPIISVVQKE